MVRETIYKDNQYHMWLFYFRNFTDLIIKIIPISNNYNGDAEYPSFAHRMIYEMFSVMTGWLELDKKQKTDYRVIDTIICLGECVNSICQTDNSKISVTFRRRQLNSILSTYFEFSHYPANIGAVTTREWIEKLFLNPNGVDIGIPQLTQKYLIALQDAWDEFDKVPYQHLGEDNGSIQQFVTNVLSPLGLTK